MSEALARLNAAGFRATVARRLLLNLLFRAEDSRSTAQLAEALRVEMPEINLSTIYRNLAEFERLGIVVREKLDAQAWGYVIATPVEGRIVNEAVRSAFVWQATGMVSEQLGVPVDAALHRLEDRAVRDERPLVDLAKDVLERLIRFED